MSNTLAIAAVTPEVPEGALVVFATKGGLDVEVTRQAFPRLAEVPFDAAYKLMATFHRVQNEQGQEVIRCFLKGAPDQLLARSSQGLDAEGQAVPIDAYREQVLSANEVGSSNSIGSASSAAGDSSAEPFGQNSLREPRQCFRHVRGQPPDNELMEQIVSRSAAESEHDIIGKPSPLPRTGRIIERGNLAGR